MMEMFNISMQFVAFPLYNYGINNYWRQQLEREQTPGYERNETNRSAHPGVNDKIVPYPDGSAKPLEDSKKPGFLPVPENNSPNDFSVGWE